MNPEFRRNLWLQLSRQRLIAMPVILGSIFALIAMVNSNEIETLRYPAMYGYYLLAGLWGTRRAADALAEEVNGATWDTQRMSSLGAWSMSWGKLLGATSFVWYGGFICLAVFVAASSRRAAADQLATETALHLMLVLLAQLVAFGSSLVLRRKAPDRKTMNVTLSQLLGLGVLIATLAAWRVSAAANLLLAGRLDGGLEWYGVPYRATTFWLMVTAAYLAWAFVGIYRLMLDELQYRTRPIVWPLFVLFTLAFVAGFFYPPTAPDRHFEWVLPTFAVSVILVYAALFGEAKGIVRYSWLVAAWRSGDWDKAIRLLPLWVPTYLIAVVLGISLSFAAGSISSFVPISLLPAAASELDGPPPVLAVLLFMLRDIGFVLWLNFSARARRADAAAFVYLLVAYVPLSSLAGSLGGPFMMAFFAPIPHANPIVTILPVGLELAGLAMLLSQRWREVGRAVRPRSPTGALPA